MSRRLTPPLVLAGLALAAQGVHAPEAPEVTEPAPTLGVGPTGKQRSRERRKKNRKREAERRRRQMERAAARRRP